MECIIPLVFRRFPDFAYFIIVPFPLLYVAFFPDVDDIRFVGSFQLDCQSNGSVVSYMWFPLMLRVLFVSVSDSQILSLRPLVMIAYSQLLTFRLHYLCLLLSTFQYVPFVYLLLSFLLFQVTGRAISHFCFDFVSYLLFLSQA